MMKSHFGSLPPSPIFQLLLLIVVSISIKRSSIVAVHATNDSVVVASYSSSEARAARGKDAASHLYSISNKTARIRHRRALRDNSVISSSSISRGAKLGRPAAFTSSSGRAVIEDEPAAVAVAAAAPISTMESPPDPFAATVAPIITKFLYDPKAAKSDGTNTATAASKAAKIAKSVKTNSVHTKSSKSITPPGLEDDEATSSGSNSGPNGYEVVGGDDGSTEPHHMGEEELGAVVDGSDGQQGYLGDDGSSSEGYTADIVDGSGEQSDVLDGTDGQTDIVHGQESAGGSDGQQQTIDEVGGSDGQQGYLGDDGSSSEGYTADIVDGSGEQSDVLDGTDGQTDIVDGQQSAGGSNGQQQTIDEVGGSQGQAFGSESGSNEGQSEENGADGQKIDQDDSSNGEQIDKAVTDSNQSSTVQSSKLSTASATVMALGLAALVTLALLLVIVVKRRRSESYTEFDNFDEHDLEEKQTDIDAASLTSSPKNAKRAYVVGEEGSVKTSATHDTRFLHAAHEAGNDNDDDMQVNVHRCTSALCPICNGRGPIFVNAMDDESAAGGFDPSLEQPHRQDRSYEYKLGEDVSAPSFRNPATEMMERPYIVDDTVAF